jgi:restriction endonuclease S subunit
MHIEILGNNQVLSILDNQNEFLQSYATVVAIKKEGKIYTSEGLYNYSKTTRKYFNRYINNANFEIISKNEFNKLKLN